MPGIVTVKHSGRGWLEVFHSDGMRQVVRDAADSVASEANSGSPASGEWFRGYIRKGYCTWLGFVSSTGPTGANYEATDKVLTKAVHRR